MAANDYYQSQPQYQRFESYRTDAPLPPLPRTYSNTPYSSTTHLNAPYSPTYSSRNDDPFEDNNSIPLNGRKKRESATSVSPILPDQPEDDPFVRDADPRRQKDRSLGRQGNGYWLSSQRTWVVWTLTVIQLAVFIAELAKNGILTGSPIEIHPSFNPMIGPSPYVMINMGARYQPCMHNMDNIQNSSVPISWPCPNATATTGASVSCSLSELCGLGGVPNPHPGGSIDEKPAPNQWYRFIIPIFIHAGIVHIGFNLLLQLTLGRDVEKLIGSIRFALVYFASGIWGFVLGGNFAATGIASCGCSGSLFGILAITLLDLLYTWKQRRGPIKDLMFIVLDICIAFVLGLLPGLDNFSHIGGFLMGLVLGVCILRSPAAFSRRIPMATTYGQDPAQNRSRTNSGLKQFIASPLGFFQDRKGMWWAWWIIRLVALVSVLIGFILLLKNFYEWRTTCGWCKYLSCLPVTVDGTNWCQIGNLDFSNSTSKRSLDLLRSASSFNPMERLGGL